MDDLREGIFKRLKHSIQLLACPPDVQLGLLPSFVCKADELALEFDNWWEVTRRNYSADLSADQLSALRAVNEKLSWMTKNAKEEWTEQAVRESQEWTSIRQLAARALDVFGWPMETPPSYAHEYVPTKPTRMYSQN